MSTTQKGFSLIEVLLSLLLVSIVALALLEQQGLNKILLMRISSYTEASYVLDQINEEIFSGASRPSILSTKYPISIKQQSVELKIPWFKYSMILKRDLAYEQG